MKQLFVENVCTSNFQCNHIFKEKSNYPDFLHIRMPSLPN